VLIALVPALNAMAAMSAFGEKATGLFKACAKKAVNNLYTIE
jgi:hypothetical protein